MSIQWNEIKSRALLFSQTWADACNEKSQSSHFWIDFKAQQKLDTAVDAAYQPSGGKKTYASDAERVAFLFELYQRITSLLQATAVKKKRKPKTIESY